MLELTRASFDEEVEGQQGLTVIDLYADWCGPCRMLAPVLDELENANPDVKFCRVNVDREPELATMFHVESIPTVAFVRDAVLQDLSVGLVPQQTLQQLIDQYR